MTLIDPGAQTTVVEATEAECRKVMARRAELKRVPGMHAVQADLLVDLDHLLDRWLELGDGQARLP